MSMIGFGYTPNSSQTQKILARTVTGDFTFALERSRLRHKLILGRNIWRFLRYHDRRLKEDPTSTNSRPNSVVNPRNPENALGEMTSGASESNGVVNGAVTKEPTTLEGHATTSNQASEMAFNMAASPRPPQPNTEKTERNTRRSGRFQELLDRVYEHADAELVLDLSSIRKKLNFKTNSLDEGERPAKRQKRDIVRCYCHLAIWDNRDGFAAIPLTTKSSYCRVTAADNGVHGYFVDLELEDPFVVKATEIRVPVKTKQGSLLEIIDKYFLEIKIIPCRADSRWPPMPILGKSDGDHFARDIRKTGSKELQGAIVARYTHLPQAPDVDIPLSVFFLHEGMTFRTKYGLQVISTWQKAGTGTIRRESNGLDLDSFLQEAPNGEELLDGAKRELKHPRTVPQKKPLRPMPQNLPEVCYSFSSTISALPEIAQEFRNATVKGYCCPLCSTWRSHKLQHLQFHLTTNHSKYSFSVQKPRRDLITNKLTQVHIKVDQPAPSSKKEEDKKEVNWIAPERPFDLRAFVTGDHSWTGETASPKIYTSIIPAAGAFSAKDVPDFRAPQRKKLKAITLETKYVHDDPEFVYTSVSHRPVSPSEEPRSETDDEIDNEWQTVTHMERLDLLAQKENWSEYKREITKRWDRHRMEERLEHPLFLWRSLIRFVRKQREWLKNSGDDELLQCFFDFLATLKERRVIDDNVVADVNELIFQDPTPPSDRERERRAGSPAETATDQTELQASEQTKTQTSAAFTCGLCNKPIKVKHQKSTFCKDPECETPSQTYHKKCALSSLTSRKGKEKAPATEKHDDKATKLSMWSCKNCMARQQEREKAKQEGRRREQEMAGREAVGSMA